MHNLIGHPINIEGLGDYASRNVVPLKCDIAIARVLSLVEDFNIRANDKVTLQVASIDELEKPYRMWNLNREQKQAMTRYSHGEYSELITTWGNP